MPHAGLLRILFMALHSTRSSLQEQCCVPNFEEGTNLFEKFETSRRSFRMISQAARECSTAAPPRGGLERAATSVINIKGSACYVAWVKPVIRKAFRLEVDLLHHHVPARGTVGVQERFAKAPLPQLPPFYPVVASRVLHLRILS